METFNSYKIVYLIRSESTLLENYTSLKTQNSDIIVSSWKENYVSKDWFDLYIHPNTTWGEGRNKLLEIAFKRNKYDYYIFMDDDVLFNADLHTPSLQEFLFKNKPMIMYPAMFPRSFNSDVIQYKNNNDAAFSIFHKDILYNVLPYYNELQDSSWWYSQGILNAVQTLTLNSYRFQYNPIRWENASHGSYSQHGWNQQKFDDFMFSIIRPEYHEKYVSPMHEDCTETKSPAQIIPYEKVDLNKFLLSDSSFMNHKNKFWLQLA